MHNVLIALLSAVFAGFRTRFALQVEIVALRHQLTVMRRSVPSRPKLHASDRFLWILLSRLWPDWRSALIIIKPETVIAWHRKGFRLFWTRKSRRHCAGRPKTSKSVGTTTDRDLRTSWESGYSAEHFWPVCKDLFTAHSGLIRSGFTNNGQGS